MSNVVTIDNGFRIAELEDQAAQQTLAMACALISLIDLRDRYTGGHSSRVAAYCRKIAVQMGLPHEETEKIVLAASLHDIGKIGVPDSVLLKQGSLTDEEFGWIRKHPEYGWTAVRNVDGFHAASLLVLHHHERWDGRGYPGNLRGEQIPLGARIIAVADSFDALTTTRPYRVGRTKLEAVKEIVRCSETQFNSQVVNAFCDTQNWLDEKDEDDEKDGLPEIQADPSLLPTLSRSVLAANSRHPLEAVGAHSVS